MTKEFKPLIDRSHHTEIGEKSALALEELVNFGCLLLKKIQDETPGSSFKVVTCLLYREVLQSIELIAMSFRNSASDSAQKLLRSLAEVEIYLRYLMKQTVIGQRDVKSWAFLYAAKQKRLAELRVGAAGTTVHKQARAVAKREISNTIYLLNEPSYIPMIDALERELKQPQYSQFDEKWKELLTKGSQPAWYTLANGPVQLDALASLVGLDSLYHRVYRHFHDHSHGVGSFLEIENSIGPNSSPILLPIRSGRYSPFTFGTAQTQGHALTKLMVQAHLQKDEYSLWNDWYESALQNGLILTKGFIKEENPKK